MPITTFIYDMNDPYDREEANKVIKINAYAAFIDDMHQIFRKYNKYGTIGGKDALNLSAANAIENLRKQIYEALDDRELNN